jgi:uncharacterized membrane protein
MTNVTHKFLSMYLFLFITLYVFRAHHAYHQERQIVSIQPLVTVILMLVGVSFAGWKFTPNLQTTQQFKHYLTYTATRFDHSDHSQVCVCVCVF